MWIKDKIYAQLGQKKENNKGVFDNMMKKENKNSVFLWKVGK